MVTFILTLFMCVLLFLLILSATYFYPWEGLLKFFPEDIEEKARLHKPPFASAPVFGWICMLLCSAGMMGVIVYAGFEGIQNRFTFGQFFTRFLFIFYGLKAFDIIGLDYFLITKSQFFQHFIPETKGCEGYHRFGYNRRLLLIANRSRSNERRNELTNPYIRYRIYGFFAISERFAF